MLRIDGRRMIREIGNAEIYGFLGVTGFHFFDTAKSIDAINNTLMADMGAGGELTMGKRRRFSIGIETGLLLPFWSNLGLEQYVNSGLIVANMYFLYRL